MTDKPCDLVISHHKLLGEIASDIAHIKKKVDNGLQDKLEKVEKTVDGFIAATNERAIRLDEQNWFTRLLTGSVKKIIGLAVLFIAINALASSGMWAFLKVSSFKEPPGQQKEILSALGEAYHAHLLPDGRTLIHAGDSSKPAWILDPVKKTCDRAPNMRTDGALE